MSHRHPHVLLPGLCVLLLGCSAHTAVAKGNFINAMSDELERSIQKLKLKDLEKPHFIEYFMWDIHSFEVKASFGAIIHTWQQDHRPFRVDVRVGSYEQDNSGYVSRNSFRTMFQNLGQVMLADEDYHALRHDLWLMTDVAYKQALEQLAGKRAYLENKVQSVKVDDFSRERPVKAVGARNTPRYEAKKWKDIVKRLSALFRDYPEIQASHVRLSADFTTRYLVNSEGSRLRQPGTVVALQARASTQADDGMPLKHYVAFYANGLDQLPDEKEMAAAIRKMAGELEALRKAEVLESYTGPVLFTEQAPGHLFHQVLAPALLAHRQPLLGISQMARMAGELKENRKDRRLLPRSFSAVDDPTRSKAGRHALIGSFTYDDEGVEAAAVNVIEKGTVLDLLASRTPMKDVPGSNGHARRGVPGFNQAQISNLVLNVEAGKKKSYDQLKKRLLDLCKDQGLSHGLIVKKLDDPDITGREIDMQAMMSASMGRKQSIDPPILAYLVGTDGSEKLVRGLAFDEFSLRTLKDIVVAGGDPDVYHRLVGTSLGVIPIPFFMSMGGRGPRIPAAPTSIVAPAVLFEELELKKSYATRKKPVLLKHPYFDK